MAIKLSPPSKVLQAYYAPEMLSLFFLKSFYFSFKKSHSLVGKTYFQSLAIQAEPSTASVAFW
jgi:hypothetical protein